tara:strand:- start:10197 stop:11459 length:1263 start_codon:yes stop_codon:yes gene_type:complete
MKKEFVVLSIFLLMIFLSSGIFAIGESCFITDRSSCESSGYVIMGLSSTTNAHGELANQSNYNNVLCCNFAGSLNCNNGTNKIIGLSSSTNAHAENPEETTYSTEVCYSDLDCISTSLNCGDTEYNLSIFSLSNSTNAHIGGINDYNTKICCTSESFIVSASNVFWSSDETTEISTLNVVTGTTSVKMILKNSGLLEGTIVSFNIYEDDLFLDDFIKTINATIDNNESAIAEWTITLEDLEKTLNDYDEFYLEVNGKINDYLSLNILETSECANIILCSDYEDEISCGNDNCQVTEITAPSDVDCDDPTRNCYCSWNTQCDFELDVLEEETKELIRVCTYVESTADDCSDGFLSYSWVATWTGAPEDKPAECSDGSRVIECPAQIQLPFFGIYNLIAAMLLIVMIYFIIFNKEKLRKFIK